MEPFDNAHKAFEQFIQSQVPALWPTMKTEADVRMKLIDPIFTDILGWPHLSICLEGVDDAGRCDYVMSKDGLTRLVVEAKKEARDLGINAAHSARFLELGGGTFKTAAAVEAIEQLTGYCQEEGAELACATNGRQWLVFRAFREGKKLKKGLACVFGSLESVLKNFNKFYDLLSYEGVVEHRFRAEFHQAEGQPVRPTTFKKAVRYFSSRRLLDENSIYADLDRVMVAFFQDITGDADDEARRKCFVTSAESDAAEAKLVRISDTLRAKVRNLRVEDGKEIADAIRRVKDMQHHEFVLLVGTKGAGKTTFVDRFFRDTLPSEISKDCVVIRVDLAPCGGDESTILQWLEVRLLQAAEKAAFGSRESPYPTDDELQGMFFGEYNRRRAGPFKHLYDTDKTAFKIKFGEYVNEVREKRPLEYTLGILNQIAHSWMQVPCIVFDNADHFSVRCQDIVYRYAASIYSTSVCLAIVPITDTTSWQLTKEGAMQSFYNDSYFLPTPPIDLVLQKRIEFIQEKIASLTPEAGKGYFMGKGIPLEVTNVNAFAASLQAIFLKDSRIMDWIGRLANIVDVRRSLNIAREIIASPHIKVTELLKAHLNHSSLSVSEDDMKLAIIRGKYDIYSTGHHNFVQNVFDCNLPVATTPLLGVRVLTYLKDAYDDDPHEHNRRVSCENVCEYFKLLAIESRSVMAVLDLFTDKGLVLTSDPLVAKLTEHTPLHISPSGLLHLEWATVDPVYIESMAMCTPLLSEDVYQSLKTAFVANDPRSLRNAIIAFITYLLNEDVQYCNVTKHRLHTSQRSVSVRYKARIESLQYFHESGIGSRYAGSVGRCVKWVADRDFGFLRDLATGSEIWVHLHQVINPENGSIPDGALAEFRLEYDKEGRTVAKSVLVLPTK